MRTCPLIRCIVSNLTIRSEKIQIIWMITKFNIISKKTWKKQHKRKTRWISKGKEFRRNIKGCFCSQNLIRLNLSFNSTEIERYKLSLSISKYILVADPTPTQCLTLTPQNISIMSPGSLQRLLREYDSQSYPKENFSTLKKGEYPSEQQYQYSNKIKKVTWVFYLNEMFNLVIRKHSKYLNSELNYTLFHYFLRDNGLAAYADFLDQCSKDIDFKDDGELEWQEIIWKKYRPFLDS